MDRQRIARECLEIERAGCSVREFLHGLGCISPWGTWYRLQREELGRKLWEIQDGKGEMVMANITPEQREEAICIAMDGKSPLPYLKECGCMKPGVAWHNIKRFMEKDEPERFAQLMAASAKSLDDSLNECAQEEKQKVEDAIRAAKEAEKPKKEKNPRKIQAEDVSKKPEPVMAEAGTVFCESLAVSALRDDTVGEFYFDAKYMTLDWRAPDGTEVSLTAKTWHQVLEKLPAVMKILGI